MTGPLEVGIDTARLHLRPTSGGRFTIVDRHLRAHLGRIAMRAPRHSVVAGGLELSYTVAAQFRRRGFAKEAAAALVGHAFAHTATARVYASTALNNIASRRVLESLGMYPVELAMHDWESLADDVADERSDGVGPDDPAPDGLDLTPFARLEYEIRRESWPFGQVDPLSPEPGHRPGFRGTARSQADAAIDPTLAALVYGRAPGRPRHSAARLA